jgi:hypothetical protein
MGLKSKVLFIIILIIVTISHSNASTYCYGEIIYKSHKIYDQEGSRPGIITEMHSLPTSKNCFQKWKSLGISHEIAANLEFKEFIIDDVVVVRGITSASIQEIEKKYTESQLDAFLCTAIVSCIGIFALFAYPDYGIVMLFTSVIIADGLFYMPLRQQLTMIQSLKSYILNVDIVSLEIINLTKLSEEMFNLHRSSTW